MPRFPYIQSSKRRKARVATVLARAGLSRSPFLQKRRGIECTYRLRQRPRSLVSDKHKRPTHRVRECLPYSLILEILVVFEARIRAITQISMRPKPRGMGLCHGEIYINMREEDPRLREDDEKRRGDDERNCGDNTWKGDAEWILSPYCGSRMTGT